MHQDMVVAERTPVQPIAVAANAPQLHHVLRELETARRVINDLAYSAYGQLDGEGMHSLAIAEGCVVGALHKIKAAGGAS